MDDRLNQVQTTDLTDSRVNHDFVNWLKTKGMNWLLAILLVACAFLGWDYLQKQKSNARDQAWEELSSATSPAAFRGVADAHAAQDAIAELATLQAGDTLLRSILSGLKPGLTAEDEGSSLTIEERTAHLAEADELYATASQLAAARSGLGGKPVGISALFGRAAIAEASGRLEDATAHLKAAAALATPEYAALAEQAEARIESMEALNGASDLPSQASIVVPAVDGETYTPPVAEDLLEFFEEDQAGTEAETESASEETPASP